MRQDDSAPRASRDDVRYGNGVPEALRREDLSYIEMTGIPRRAWVRDADEVVEDNSVAPTEAAPPEASVAPQPTGTAAALFQDLLNTLGGDGPVLDAGDSPEMEEGIDTSPAEPTVEFVDFTPKNRPAQAVQALMEAESLFRALDQTPTPVENPVLDAASVDAVRAAFETAPGAPMPQQILRAQEPPTPLEIARDLAPLGGMAPAQDEATSHGAPLEIHRAESPLETAITSHDRPAPKVAQPPNPVSPGPFTPGSTAPGYTLLGHGPITWPGEPPRGDSASRGLSLVVLAMGLAGFGVAGYLVQTAGIARAGVFVAPAVLVGAAAVVAAALLWAYGVRARRMAVLRGLNAVSQSLGAEVIGAVPVAQGLARVEALDGSAWSALPLLAQDPPANPIAEAFDTLRTNFRFAAPVPEVHSVCFVGAVPGEGAKTVAFNFAASQAQRGQHVLFVAADRDRAANPRVVEHPQVPRLYCANVAASGAGYDLVVWAGEALLASPDARRQAGAADATVLVLDPALTGRAMAVRAMGLLRASNARLAGIVVNRVRSSSLRRAYVRRATTRV